MGRFALLRYSGCSIKESRLAGTLSFSLCGLGRVRLPQGRVRLFVIALRAPLFSTMAPAPAYRTLRIANCALRIGARVCCVAAEIVCSCSRAVRYCDAYRRIGRANHDFFDSLSSPARREEVLEGQQLTQHVSSAYGRFSHPTGLLRVTPHGTPQLRQTPTGASERGFRVSADAGVTAKAVFSIHHMRQGEKL